MTGSQPAETLTGIERRNVYWSLVAFGAVGLSGLLLNLVIANRYGERVLGQFNVLLAVFIVGGQVGAAGVQSAVLFFTSRARALRQSTSNVLLAALRVSVATALVCTIVVLTAGQIVLSAHGYRAGLWLISVGLFLYPANKVMLAHLNGLGRIRLFSALLALRYVLLVATVGMMVWRHIDGIWLPTAVSVTESILAATSALLLFSEFRGGDRDASRALSPAIRRFGFRGMAGGLLLDLNTRVDVLVLGSISGSAAVGRYSIASVFAEGLYQLALVTRSSFDPVVAGLYAERRLDDLRRILRVGRRRVYRWMIPVCLITTLLYSTVVSPLFGHELARESWSVYAILSLGVLLSAGYIPFISLLQQTGDAAAQSMLVGAMSATNLGLNLMFVPFWGPVGSATATAIAQASLVPFLRVFVRRHVGEIL